MEKASKAIRRSSVRLKSMSGGHGDLQMVISQLGEVRTNLKAFTQAQATAAEDVLSWAAAHENRAIAETFNYLSELSILWTEVQKEFTEQLKEYRTQYELILEGEKHVSLARETLASREQREAKLRKELKKVGKKTPQEEIRLLREKLNQAERSRDLSHLEVVERVAENEAVKMIRVKEGLLKVGAAYCELGQKCLTIFTAHQNIAMELPDVHDRDLHDIKYTGGGAARKSVQQAKDQVLSYKKDNNHRKAPLPEDPPPPYTPSVEHLNDLSANTNHNGTNGFHDGTMNNSSLNPSAPQASMSSINSPLQEPHNHISRSRPAAPRDSNASFSSPPEYSPTPNVYPHLPSAFPASDIQPHIPTQPSSQDTPVSPHSSSAPNLLDESPSHHSVSYPPLNLGDNSSYNDSSYHPDASSSSPNLSFNRQPACTSTPESTAPYNPHYDWLPARTKKTDEEGNVQDSKNEDNVGKPKENPNTPSVRPRTGRNPFVDDSSGDEDREESLSSALRRSSVK